MRKHLLASGLFSAVAILAAMPAAATYHIVVIQQVFGGYEQAPGAQYVVLRLQADLQTFVRGQALPTFDAAGDSNGDFAAFCDMRTGCDLPATSPACAQGGCPSPFTGNDSSVLVATEWARDLFCVTPDLLATGQLPYPDGRVCFGDVGPFAGSCDSTGPVDCVAYGEFAGDNGIFGSPSAPLTLGLVLAGEPSRPGQCNVAGLNATGVCLGGTRANGPCSGLEEECPSGECRACPDEDCSSLLSSAAGFSQAIPPAPRNFHGDVGQLDGTIGDADGDSLLTLADVDQEREAIFEAGMRCNVEPARRGADTNLDAWINAADLVAVIQLVAIG